MKKSEIIIVSIIVSIPPMVTAYLAHGLFTGKLGMIPWLPCALISLALTLHHLYLIIPEPPDDGGSRKRVSDNESECEIPIGDDVAFAT